MHGGQSRTGGVLAAVTSASVMGARRIFSKAGGGKFRDGKKFFLKLTTVLVVALKIQVFTVNTNAQTTLHIQGDVP